MKSCRFILFPLAITLMILAGCSNQSNPLYSGGNDNITPSYKASLPAGAQIESAILYLEVARKSGEPITVHRITAEWEELAVSWNSFAQSYDTVAVAQFAASEYGEVSVDITSLVTSWADGSFDNFGLLLKQDNMMSEFHSSNHPDTAFYPRLEICYSSASGNNCIVITDTPDDDNMADTYIAQNIPTGNMGAIDRLFVGKIFTFSNHGLLRFEFDVAPAVGAVSGFAWQDLNADGIQNTGEPGFEGVTFRLFDCLDNFVAETVTDNQGYYAFNSIPFGKYYLLCDGYGNMNISPENQGSSEDLDSDFDPVTQRTECFEIVNVVGGTQNPGPDVGFYEDSNPGCTRNMIYWMLHSGMIYHKEDLVSDLLPIWLGNPDGSKSIFVESSSTALHIFWMRKYGSPWNPITRLYAHLLTAKLNIANGADDSAIRDIITEIDDYLAENDWRSIFRASKNKVTRKQIHAWTKQLIHYNNGRIGPGKCHDRRQFTWE